MTVPGDELTAGGQKQNPSAGNVIRTSTRIIGAILLVVGATLQFGFTTAIVSQRFRQQAFLANREFQEALRMNRPVPQLVDSIESSAARQTAAVSTLVMIVSVVVGWFVAQMYVSPPILYLFLTGLVPGGFVFFGWKKLHPGLNQSAGSG